jgi:hypothetical protein
MLTWDRTGLLGESGGPSIGKGRESDMESRDLQGGSPRLCQLWTNGLAPMSKYWTYWSHAEDMGLVKWCSLLPTDAWLFPIPPMTVMEEKLGMDLQIGQSVCCRLGRDPFFSIAVEPFNSVDDSLKVCHIRGLPLVWQNHLRNEGFKSQDNIGGSLMMQEFANTHIKHTIPYLWSSSNVITYQFHVL